MKSNRRRAGATTHPPSVNRSIIVPVAAIMLIVLALSGCAGGPPPWRSGEALFLQVSPGGGSVDLSGIAADQPVFVEVAADPSLGFRSEYLLFIPVGARTTDEPTRLVVEPNNTGTVSDDHAVHAEAARRRMTGGRTRRIAEELGTPLLIPVFDRPETGWQRYTHALDSDTMEITDGPLRRVDLQLIAMIGHARTLLEEVGIAIDERVLMNGFSASANFTNRFAALHPQIVRAAATGGVNAMPILPVASIDGMPLPFHVGVADIDRFTGRPFDQEAYRRVAQYIYMGERDDNDTLPYDDAYNDDERELTVQVLGATMTERWESSQAIFASQGFPVRFVTYRDIGHEVTGGVVRDVTRFFEANMGEEINLPEPTGRTVAGMRDVSE